MESRAKIAGHPAHPMFVVFPLALLVVATLFDVVWFATDDTMWSRAAFWNIAAGGLGGVIAAVFGLIDWLAVPDNTRAKLIGVYHALGNVVVLATFGVSWGLRYSDATHEASAGTLLLQVLGLGFAVVSGWLGGELSQRMGIGVDEGAHVNSPSSLSDLPASASVQQPTFRMPEPQPQ